jgi:hypothetical protein
MAINDFPHAIPNNQGDKTRKEEPDLSYEVPNQCGVSTHYGTSYIKTCAYPGSIFVDENITSVGGNITATTGTVSGVTLTATGGVVNGTATGNKTLASFDIPHVKQKGKRIRHIIAEGPEPGIYIRGKLKDSNIIELPEYWDGLVDPETITVTLTQIGSSQDLIVENIEDLVVTIRSGTGANIHCYYEVWVARWLNPMNHSEKLVVVYDGETPDAYPGGNENFLIGGWDYDRRNPQWESQGTNPQP